MSLRKQCQTFNHADECVAILDKTNNVSDAQRLVASWTKPAKMIYDAN
jgi:hypothetical protein